MNLEHLIRSLGVVLGPQYDSAREALSSSQTSGRGIETTFDLTLLDDGARLSLSVTNGSDRELSEIIFPDIQLDPKGPESGFTMPVGPGWWQPFEPLDEGESITWNYPVFGAMQWVSYCDEGSGVYFGVHDKTPLTKLFTVGKRNGCPWLRVRFTDLRLMPGERLMLPPLVVREHLGDWHTGAAFYREWAESWMSKPTGAEWYDPAPAWCWSGFRGQHARKPGRLYSDAPAQAKARADYGVVLTNAGGWMEHGHDTHYPDYFAGESMGGEQGMRDMIRAIHDMGLRISLYTNGRIADPDGSIGSMPGWLNWAVHGPDPGSVVPMQALHANFTPAVTPDIAWNEPGTAVTETYDKVTFAAMCPGSPQWRELFISRMETVARYGADGTFVDQICGAWAYPCYSDQHDHDRPSEAWSGYLTLLRELRSRLRAINPEFQMTTEGVCDLFGQFFDVQQGHNDWDTQVGVKSRPMPELYGYTFPWYTINTGFASRNNYYYLKLAHAVGSGLDLCDLEADGCEQRFLDYVRQIMIWRRDYAEVLRRGEFLGALKCDNPHYLAHAFRLAGKMVVTAAWVPYKCEPEKPVDVALKLGRRPISARLFTEEGEREARINGDTTTVPVTEIALLEVDIT